MKRILLGTFFGSVVGGIIAVAVYLLWMWVTLTYGGANQIRLNQPGVTDWEALWNNVILGDGGNEPPTLLLFGIGFGAVVGTLVAGFQHLTHSMRISTQALLREMGEKQPLPPPVQSA